METNLPSPLIFISYSRTDTKNQQRLVAALRERGLTVWVDNEKLNPGNPAWDHEIEKAILACSAIVVILSPESKRSEWVRREVSFAEQHNKRIFPVLVRGDESSTLTLRMINHQFIDMRQNEKAGIEILYNSLSNYLDPEKNNSEHEFVNSSPASSKSRIWTFAALGTLAIIVAGSFFLKNALFSSQPAATATVHATIASTKTVQPEVIPNFFTEDFNRSLDNWEHFTIGDQTENQIKTSIENGFMNFDIAVKGQRYYNYYAHKTYNNVRIDIHSENRGDFNNITTLFCRYHEDKGWYEFNFDNGGLYKVLYVKLNEDKTETSSTFVANGGSKLINTGRAVNDYSVICNDRTLSVWINGTKVNTVIEDRFVLEDGYVGFGVSPGKAVPVTIRIDSFTISQP